MAKRKVYDIQIDKEGIHLIRNKYIARSRNLVDSYRNKTVYLLKPLN